MLRPERSDIFTAVAYSLVIGLLSLALPVSTQLIVNTIAFGTLLQPLVVLTAVVFAALGFSAALQALRSVAVEMIQRRVFVRIGAGLVEKLLRVNAESLQRQYGPELVNRFFEVVTVQKASAILLVDGLSVAMQTLLGMMLLAVYHPLLLAFDLILLVAIALVLFGAGRGAIATSIDESKAKYAVAAWLEELAGHPVSFKSSTGRSYAIARADNLFTRYLSDRSRHFRIVLRQHVGFLVIQAVASAILLGGGGWLVMNNQLTLGQLVAAELVVALILTSLAKFAKYFETYYDLVAATDKLGHLEDLPMERSGGSIPAVSRPGVRIQLRDVSYHYPGRAILQNVDWEIPAGCRIGLTGTSGQGKTTLLDLIYGLRTPSGGSIELDDHDLRDLDLVALRSSIALVRPQGVFHGTIEDNLRMGDPRIDNSDIRRALSVACLQDDIASLPDGLRTVLSTTGRPLSNGQCTRLMIARAVLARPRMLILDEVLDSLDDTPQRSELLDMLFREDANWTVLVVTEDEKILARCDEVYQIEKGKLEERKWASKWK